MYEQQVRPALIERFGYVNALEAPQVVKVCVSTRVSEGKSGQESTQNMDAAIKELAIIVGQRPAITRARKSIATFNIREGMPIGVRTTLRGARAWEFIDRLFNVALPRIRDFRGLERSSFDGRGNYSIGIDDHLIFPELGYDDVQGQRGLNIVLVTTAKSDEEAAVLLEGLGLPLKRIEEGS